MKETTEEKTCRNCETPLRGEFCHHCGQSAKRVRRPVGELASEVFGGFLQWDSRLFHTLRTLFLRPGKLTSDWVEGKRARHVPPFRLYLLASLILFLLVGMLAREMVSEGSGIVIEESAIAELQKEGEQAKEDGDWVSGASVEAVGKAIEDPQRYFRNIIANLPKAAFLLLPVFALLLNALNFRQKHFFIDYIVFSLHFHTVIFLLVSVIVFVKFLSTPLGEIADALNLFIPVYLAMAFKQFNGQGWLKSILKSLLAIAAYSLVLGVAVVLFFGTMLYL